MRLRLRVSTVGSPRDRIEDRGPLARVEMGQVVVGFVVEEDRIGHGA
jgi:hypothetical protein